MTAEPLGNNTYKITLDKREAASMPSYTQRSEMHRFICKLIDSLSEDDMADIPDGRLLAEVFLRSDGSCVIFVTALEQDTNEYEASYYSCDVSGIEQLRTLCRALAKAEISCAVYCGDSLESYRLIFPDPPSCVEHICEEFGDYCEVTRLFASRTEEYLTEIFPFGDIRSFADML